MKIIHDYTCMECGAACIESPADGRLLCLRCSRICRDFKPPDFQPAADWDFPEVYGVEVMMVPYSGSLTEHAHEDCQFEADW